MLVQNRKDRCKPAVNSLADIRANLEHAEFLQLDPRARHLSRHAGISPGMAKIIASVIYGGEV